MREPSGEEKAQYCTLCAQNVTCFNALEATHPINFFEQRDMCEHCGAERLRTMNPNQCCQGGKLVLERSYPSELLEGAATADDPAGCFISTTSAGAGAGSKYA